MEETARDFIAGTGGGMLGVLAGQPMDLAKTRLQAMPKFDGLPAWRVVVDTARHEGPLALYRGMSFPLYSACVVNAVVFSVQGATERLLKDAIGDGHARLNGFVAGCVAGLAQSPLVSATDLIKCQRQVMVAAGRDASALPGPMAVLRQRVKQLGAARGLLQGLGATALKECPSYGVYFLVYEQAKATTEGSWQWHPAVATLVAGGAAGCVSLGMIHPVDVVKTRVQALPVDAPRHETSALGVAARGLRAEGSAFFLKGFGAAMQRAFVVNAATFAGYELVSGALTGAG